MAQGPDHAVQTEQSSVLLLGNYRPTVTVARELSCAGYNVIAGMGGGEGGAEYSRFTAETWTHPDLVSDPDRFAYALGCLLCRRRDIAAVFPITDEFVAYFAERGDEVSADVLIASPPAEVVRRARDKLAMLELARVSGVPCAPHCVVDEYAALAGEARRIGYPLVIRPMNPQRRLGSKKALICGSEAELHSALPNWPAEQPGLLLQRCVAGPRHNVFFSAHKGEILQSVETRIKRTDMLDGTGLAVDGETVAPSPLLARYCETLAGALDYTGVGLFQFIHDEPSGRTCFLELNPRIAGSHAITALAGLDLAKSAIDLARGVVPEVDMKTGKAGIRYAWTYGDLRGLKAALGRGELSIADVVRWMAKMLATLVQAHHHMTWRVDDPMPALNLLAQQLPGFGRHGREGQSMPQMRGLRDAYTK